MPRFRMGRHPMTKVDRNRDILESVMAGETMRSAARRHGITVQRVGQIIEQEMKELGFDKGRLYDYRQQWNERQQSRQSSSQTDSLPTIPAE